MHVGQLPQPLREALAQNNCPPIQLRVLMTASYRNVASFTSGVPTFAAGYTTLNFDLSSRLIGGLTFSQSKPIFPDGDGFSRSSIDLELVNTDGYISCLQSGAMVRLSDIDQATVQIDALISDIVQPVSLFRGRILGPPREEVGKTTFTVVDTIWDAIKRPVLYEAFVNIAGSQEFSVVRGLPIPTYRRVDTLSGGHFCVYNGVVSWDAQGLEQLRVTNTDATKIDITKISIANRAKLGVYTIKFSNAANFTLTYPDNSQYKGTITTDTVTPMITIARTSWTTADGSGVTITFNVGVCLKGNPVTIARNFIEKALLQNWGLAPANTLQVKIDAATWNAAEARFKSYTIYLSETNASNEVWQRKAGAGAGKNPMNCLELAQKALDHVGCFLQMRQDGFISIVTPFFDGRKFYDITSNEFRNLIVEPETQWNVLTLQYGEDNGSFAKFEERDLRVSPTDEINQKVVSCPYWKDGASRFRALWMLDTYVRRYYARQQKITIDVIPQFGLPMLCGDIVRIVSTTQPIISLICEVVSITVNPAGWCKLDLVIVQQYEGDAFKLCVAKLENERLW